jgi:hypothetical protein
MFCSDWRSSSPGNAWLAGHQSSPFIGDVAQSKRVTHLGISNKDAGRAGGTRLLKARAQPPSTEPLAV